MNLNLDGTMNRDSINDNKKCGVNPDDDRRQFKLNGETAQEGICQAICNDNPNCRAMSGIWGDWCIGCDTPLDYQHDKAIAFIRSK